MLALLLAALAASTAPIPVTRIAPDSQAVFVELDPSRPHVTGSTSLWFALADSARTLALECDGIELSRVTLSGAGGVLTTAWAAGSAGLRVDVLRGLPPGAYELDVAFLAPWREQGGWRRGRRVGAALDSLRVAAAFPCAGDSVATSWRLHVQTPRALRASSMLQEVRRERDREVEVSEWRSTRALAARELRLRARPRAGAPRAGAPR